jgi:YidC/Oxa1 family membrane protein insertase
MQNQQRNLIIWLVCSVLFMFAWTSFSAWMGWGPPKPTPRQVQSSKPEDSARVVESTPVPSEARDPVLVAQVVATGHLQESVGSPNLVAPALLAAELSLLPPPPTKPDPPVVVATPETPEETIELGTDQGNLKAQLTSRGGSVRSLNLNRFNAADDFGLPMYINGDTKSPFPLQLLSPDFVRSRRNNQIVYDPNYPYLHYVLYHYAKPDDERPVDTLGKLNWKVEKKSLESDRQEVTFGTDVPGQKIHVTKTFSLAPGDYHIGLKVGVQSTATDGKPVPFRYQLEGAHGLPIEGEWYTSIFRNALIGGVDQRGVAWRSLEDARQIGHWLGGDAHEKQGNHTIRYAGTGTQYFASMMVVAEKDRQPSGRDDFIQKARATVEGRKNAEKPFLDDFAVRIMTEPLPVEPGKTVEQDYVLYNGPVKVRLLYQLTGKQAVDPALVDRYENKLGLYALTDFPSPTIFGEIGSWTGLTPLIIYVTNLLHTVLGWMYTFLPAGLCILCLTIMVRGIMAPLSYRQTKATQVMQDKMAKLAPEVKKLEAKYKDDPMGLYQARNELYKAHNINPFGAMGGCLLVFAQMPVFLGLYYALQESIQFRLAKFLWIENLAAPDMLFPWPGRWKEGIPFISDPANQGSFLYLGPFFNLLPIIAVGFMMVQQRLTMPPATTDEQKQQQEMMKWMMPVFGLMFYKVAAGMCIYFTASSLWGLAERKLLPKNKASSSSATPSTAPPATTNRSTNSRDRNRSGRGRDSRSAKDATEGSFMQKVRDWVDDVLEQAKKK